MIAIVSNNNSKALMRLSVQLKIIRKKQLFKYLFHKAAHCQYAGEMVRGMGFEPVTCFGS